MNLGVNLSNPPQDARDSVTSITHEGTRYYIAESTGGNWKEGWRVGECPENLKQVSAQVITLEDAEQVAPGQVSASFTAMEPSAISLEISPSISLQNGVITFRGQLAPEVSNGNITLYARINSSPWAVIGTAVTQPDGRFEYVWTADSAGSYAIRAAWSGNERYTGAMSSAESATVIPLFLGALVAVAVLAVVIGAIAVLMAKHTQQEPIEP
jgi:hypothetical protein